MAKTFKNFPQLAQQTFHNWSAVRRKMSEGFNESRFEEEMGQDEYYVYDDPKFQTVLFLLYTFVFSVCFFGNLTVVLVMRLHWRMRSVTKFCLGNLAFANFCVSIFCIYQNLSLYLMDSWIFGDVLCKMYHFINSLSHTASILILVVISAERYFAILHPFKCRRMLTIQRLRLIILAVWITSALLCSPKLIFIVTIRNQFATSKGEGQKYEVICSIGTKFFDSKIADLINFLLLFLLPMLIITILYTKIALFLHKRQFFPSTNSKITNTHSTIPALSDSSTNDYASSITVDRNRKHSTSKKHCYIFKSQKSGSKDQTLKTFLTKKSKVKTTVLGKKKCNCDLKMKSKISGRELDLKKDFKVESKICVKNFEENFGVGKSKICRKKLKENIFVGDPKNIGTRFGRKTMKKFRFSRTNFARAPIQRKSLGILCSQDSTRSLGCKQRGIVRMLVLIVVTFAICNLPFHVRKLYQHFFHKPQYENVWTDLSTPTTFLLMYANCAINPFLYAFMSRSFRYCVKDLFKCRLRRPTFL